MLISFSTAINRSTESIDRTIDHIFTWKSQQEELRSLRPMITVLRFYDIKEEVTVQYDASEKGLGATLPPFHY